MIKLMDLLRENSTSKYKYGGNGGKHSEETKNKIGKANSKPKPKGFGDIISKIKKGMLLSQETKDKISKGKTNHKCYKNPKRGEKISKSLKGRDLIWFKKQIIQYDLNMNFIKEWDSLKEAAESLKIHPNNIGSALQNKSKTANKYIWKYK